VAAVSAYEAHIVNVTAHVENALTVSTVDIDFNTVYPQQFWLRDFAFSTSESFASEWQQRVYHIDYELWAEWKPKDSGYYPWLGDALWLAQEPVLDLNGDGEINLADDTVPRVWTYVGEAPSGPPGARKVLGPVTMTKPGVVTHSWCLALDVPVFEGYPLHATTPPSGLSAPTLVILKTDPRYHPEGIELGVDIKIQITGIYE